MILISFKFDALEIKKKKKMIGKKKEENDLLKLHTNNSIF